LSYFEKNRNKNKVGCEWWWFWWAGDEIRGDVGVGQKRIVWIPLHVLRKFWMKNIWIYFDYLESSKVALWRKGTCKTKHGKFSWNFFDGKKFK
jgi:hypothetical protein